MVSKPNTQRTESSQRRADANTQQRNEQQAPEREPHQELEQAPPSYSPPPPPQDPIPPERKPKADPVTQMLLIQKDVMNLMQLLNEFSGDKKDKNYLYLDVTLGNKLIDLDNINADDKDIKTAKKEVIICIQKCLALLEIKVQMYQEAEEAAGENEKLNEDVDMEEPKAEVVIDQPQQYCYEGAEIKHHPETVVATHSYDTRTKERQAHYSRHNDPTAQVRHARNKSKEDSERMEVDGQVEQQRVPKNDNYHSSF